MNATPETVFSGRTVTATLLDGTQAEFKVRQIPLGEYEHANKLLDDEIAFTAFVCGHDKQWADALTPDAYEELYTASLEVNSKGFFSWKARRDGREQEKESRRLAAQAGADATRMIVLEQAGITSRSPTGSPSQRPRPE